MTSTERAFRGPLLPQPTNGCGFDQPGGRVDPPHAQLQATLDAAVAHETALLNEVGHAHTRGYDAAVTQLRALLELAYEDTRRPAECPGLMRALTLLDRVDLARPSTHHLNLRVEPGQDAPTYRLHCTAETGAPCRVTCEGAVRGMCDADRCHPDCTRDLVDSGHCLAAAWLGGAADDLFTAYVGPARPLAPGPVAVRWDPAVPQWEWMFAVDLPDTITAQEWTRGQA